MQVLEQRLEQLVTLEVLGLMEFKVLMEQQVMLVILGQQVTLEVLELQVT